ncbi:MAG TPA: histidine kinase [Terriglobales bacterium]
MDWPIGAIRDHFVWSRRAPLGAGEIRRTERWLASARVFLAVAALVAVWMDPTQIGYSLWVYALLAFYIGQGVIIILLLRRRPRSTPSFRLLVHAADIIWPALISIFAVGQSNIFFLFFVFVLAASAYRWGLWETTGTAAAAVVLLWLESLSFHLGFFSWLNDFLASHHLPALHIDSTDFEPKRLFMRSVYLLVLGLLLGFLAEQQKRLRAERALIARIVGKARVETGVSGTLGEISADLLSIYGARQLLVASQEGHTNRVFVGELKAAEPTTAFHWLDPSGGDQETYMFQSAAAACCGHRLGDGTLVTLGLDENGRRVHLDGEMPFERLSKKYEFRTIVCVSFVLGREWLGRVILLDPVLGGDSEEELRFLLELAHQVAPAVHNVLLLRRLRLRAGAVERARFARELHDGAVQSLIAVEMQVDVLRRQSAENPEVATAELGRIQALLREEVLKLRELMQQLKTLDVDSRRLVSVINDTVERFQRETGIAAGFSAEVGELEMPQPVCREIVRIVQEALVNVRKHSGAKHVKVRLAEKNAKWRLQVEDDGAGYPFAGRFTQAELDAMGKGPLVIKERVRLIEGQLTIESIPGQGTSLEISVPKGRGALHG